MPYEVEQKFPAPDLEPVRFALIQLGATVGQTLTQVDTYYAHPVRDFATTDEAFRIRRVDQSNYFTYKGPKLDAATKTRQEIEIPFAEGNQAAEQGDRMLAALGFRRVAEVSKVRQAYHFEYHGHAVEFALDTIDDLGTFVELEIVVADEAAMDSAKDIIHTLTTNLGLTQPERRSYLELLLEKKSS